MRISGSYMVKAEAMLHTSLRIQEEMMIANVTKNLSSEGKHVINIIHGTPSTAFGIETQTLTFLWEADTEDPLYKKLEEIKETRSKIKSCKTHIENLKRRITAAENAKESDVETVHKEEKVDYEKEYKEYKKKKGSENATGVWLTIVSLAWFVVAIILASEEISGFGSFICGCVGVLFFGIGCSCFNSAKDLNLEEFKKGEERIAKMIEDEKRNEKRKALTDKANLSNLKAKLERKEKELAELEKQLKELNGLNESDKSEKSDESDELDEPDELKEADKIADMVIKSLNKL